MSKSFISNLKTLLLIVAKSASVDPDCPVAYPIMSSVIERLFAPEYDNDNWQAYKLHKDRVSKLLEKRGVTMEEAVERKERCVFDTTGMVLPCPYSAYSPHLQWYSKYVRERMPQGQVDTVFRYVKRLNTQV